VGVSRVDEPKHSGLRRDTKALERSHERRDARQVEPVRKEPLRDAVDFEDMLDRLSKGVNVSFVRRK